MKLVFATRNDHKLREARAILGGTGIDVDGLDATQGEPPESGETFESNAAEKARWVFERLGVPTIADDSGIEVRALGWAPGVRSKRWTAEGTDAANNARLLHELSGKTDRCARYRCALALVWEGGEEVAVGSCEGSIGFLDRGSGGFGYDPLFWPDEAPGRTMAELSMEEKNAISHRGRAFRQLPDLVVRAFGPLPQVAADRHQ